MPTQYLGRGGGGLRKGGQLEEDIYRMGDPGRQATLMEETREPAIEANAEQNLQTAFGDDPDAQMRSIIERLSGNVEKQAVRKGLKDLDPVEDYDAYVTAVDKKIKEMYKAAQGVKASGTGNTTAYNTYLQVANSLIDRLKQLQNENVQRMATSQPAEDQ